MKKDTEFIVNGRKIKKSELMAVFTDLVHFGVQWDREGNTYAYNYVAQQWEAVTDDVLKKYLIERRKILGIDLRGKKETIIVGTLRYLAKQMRVSEKWFKEQATSVDFPDEVPEMQWEKLYG